MLVQKKIVRDVMDAKLPLCTVHDSTGFIGKYYCFYSYILRYKKFTNETCFIGKYFETSKWIQIKPNLDFN